MAKLTEPQKLFIVKALACFDTPSQVATAVRDAFGIEVDRRRVQDYDPTSSKGHEIGARLRAVFEETRRAFLADVSAIPRANQAVRLRALDRMAARAEQAGNAVQAAALMEQIAKEVGGAFTNRRELTGKGGGPIEQATATTSVTSEEFRRITRRVLDEV